MKDELEETDHLGNLCPIDDGLIKQKPGAADIVKNACANCSKRQNGNGFFFLNIPRLDADTGTIMVDEAFKESKKC